MSLRQEVLEQMKAASTVNTLPGEIKEFSGSTGFQKIRDNTLKIPAVIVSSEIANYSDLSGDNYIRHLKKNTVSVFIIVEDKTEKRGADASDEAQRIGEIVINVLAPWVPTGFSDFMKPGKSQIKYLTNFRYSLEIQFTAEKTVCFDQP